MFSSPHSSKKKKMDKSNNKEFSAGSDAPVTDSVTDSDSDYCRRLTLSSKTQEQLSRKETWAIHCLRLSFLGVLLLTTIVVSACVFLYTRYNESSRFSTQFEDSALEIIESFHAMLETSLTAASSMSAAITSYALKENLTFPYVTVPDFELLGSHLRIISGSHIVHWMPIVTDAQRTAWEDYALENRFHIDEAFAGDQRYRLWQDEEFGIAQAAAGGNQAAAPTEESNATVLDDGTGYHPKIYGMQGKVARDEVLGAGPFMLLWQRSPINPAKQKTLNTNWAKLPVLAPNIIDTMQREKKALINTASIPPNDYFRAGQEKNLQISQYRETVADLVDGPSTYLTYPVFDSFQRESRSVKGVLATSIYWKVLFSRLLPSKAPPGIICVVENSFNQYFSFRIDGPQAIFLGFGDKHDRRFDKYELAEDINNYLESKAGPHNRPYTSVSFSDSIQYTIRVFPSQDTQDEFITNTPVTYTMAFVAAFVFCAVLFTAFSYMVERRQAIMMDRVVSNARRATQAERELNEFLSHEVRNPLAVAITACSFVSTALADPKHQLLDENHNVRQDVCDDLQVVNSSLCFVNDFLRSMLDTHRLSDIESGGGQQLKVTMAPTDILRDVLQPVSTILYNKRTATFQVIVDCPPDLVVLTDCIRLKQVILNLARNATKFVEQGYVRMRAQVDPASNLCRIYVEDSGPGIPKEKRGNLFGKYQESLDLLSQGTGIGLNLSKRLMKLMNNGDVWLDDSYRSTIQGCPGACFVVELNTPPLDMESTLDQIQRSQHERNDMMYDDQPPETAIGFASSTMKDGGPDLESGLVPDAAPPATTASLFDLSPHSTVPPTTSTPAALFAIPPVPCPTAAAESSPVPQPPPIPQRPAITTVGPNLPSGLSVLFVDDDAVLRKLFVRSLKRVEPSWQIQEAACGETAIQMCEEASQPFDLIFMDQYMASVTKMLLGTETVQLMRAKGVKSKICGLSANDIRDSFIKAGADSFCLKPMPCKADQLKQMLFDILVQGNGNKTAP